MCRSATADCRARNPANEADMPASSGRAREQIESLATMIAPSRPYARENQASPLHLVRMVDLQIRKRICIHVNTVFEDSRQCRTCCAQRLHIE